MINTWRLCSVECREVTENVSQAKWMPGISRGNGRRQRERRGGGPRFAVLCSHMVLCCTLVSCDHPDSGEAVKCTVSLVCNWSITLWAHHKRWVEWFGLVDVIGFCVFNRHDLYLRVGLAGWAVLLLLLLGFFVLFGLFADISRTNVNSGSPESRTWSQRNNEQISWTPGSKSNAYNACNMNIHRNSSASHRTVEIIEGMPISLFVTCIHNTPLSYLSCRHCSRFFFAPSNISRLQLIRIDWNF